MAAGSARTLRQQQELQKSALWFLLTPHGQNQLRSASSAITLLATDAKKGMEDEQCDTTKNGSVG